MRTRHLTIGLIAALTLGMSVILIAAVIALSIPSSSHAMEQLDFVVEDMTTQLDKNGNEYTRFIVPKATQYQGHVLEYGVPAMAFGDLNAQAKQFEPGDQVSAIVSHRKLPDGRESYTILKFLMTDD